MFMTGRDKMLRLIQLCSLCFVCCFLSSISKVAAMMLSNTGGSFHTTLQYTDSGVMEERHDDTVDNSSNYNINNYQVNNSSNSYNNPVESDQVETIITNGLEVDLNNENSTVDINNITNSVDATVPIAAADDLTTTTKCIDSTTHSIATEILFTTISDELPTEIVVTTTCDEIYDRLQINGSLPMLDFKRELEKVLLACGIQDSSSSGSPLEAYNLFNHYIDLLRDYYYELFIEQCKELTTRQQCMVVGDQVLQECTAAMTGSVPHSIIIIIIQQQQRKDESIIEDGLSTHRSRSNGYNWSIEGPLEELRLDIESYVSSINVRPPPQDVTVRRQFVSPNSSRGKTAPFLFPRGIRIISISPVWTRRLKWLAAQTLVLGFNFVQYEVQRRLKARANAKRLAEVPEFPLL